MVWFMLCRGSRRGGELNGLALCAGVGMLDLAIAREYPQARTVCYVEGEAYAASVLVAQMDAGALDEAPLWSNVATFDGRPWCGAVDYISAGFPCQPFSYAGNRKTVDDPRHIWPHIARIIGETRPRWLFLENVPGLLNGPFGGILADLARLGFNVEWGCLRANEVGAPHRRNRLFIFAENEDHANANGQPLIRSPGRERDRPQVICSAVGDPNGERFGKLPLPEISSEAEIPHRPTDERPGNGDGWWLAKCRVRRVVDGVADRVDRIRACGNGVVPQQAAAAYRMLAARREEGLK